MTLQFGVWDHFERQRNLPVDQQYRDRIQLVALAEQHGFYGYHVAEHHLTPLDLAPSQTVYLAALAQHTSRIRLGTMVLCLPLYHPVRLIQEICMVDQISSGRFMPGVGRGVRDIEHQWFGIDPAETRERFDETLQILIDGLSTGVLDHAGKYYSFDGVKLDLEPYQKPYPPFWYAGNLEYAAKMGMNVVGSGDVSKAELRLFWELWEEGRTLPNPVNPQVTKPLVGSSRHMLLAETNAEAERIANRALPVLNQNFLATPLPARRAGAAPQVSPYSAETVTEARKSSRVIVGTPASALEQLGGYLEDVGADYSYVVNAFQWGDITHEEASRSLELFATEVMPVLQKTAAAATR